MNGDVCCILGVCCPPDSVQRRGAIIKQLVADLKVSDGDAGKVADWILANFDLTKKGMLRPLLADIAAMVKAHG